VRNKHFSYRTASKRQHFYAERISDHLGIQRALQMVLGSHM